MQKAEDALHSKVLQEEEEEKETDQEKQLLLFQAGLEILKGREASLKAFQLTPPVFGPGVDQAQPGGGVQGQWPSATGKKHPRPS